MVQALNSQSLQNSVPPSVTSTTNHTACDVGEGEFSPNLQQESSPEAQSSDSVAHPANEEIAALRQDLMKRDAKLAKNAKEIKSLKTENLILRSRAALSCDSLEKDPYVSSNIRNYTGFYDFACFSAFLELLDAEEMFSKGINTATWLIEKCD
jgi:hypothetical protein